MENGTKASYSGVGIRGVAMAIDSFVWFALFFVSTYLVAIFSGDLVTGSSGVSSDLTGTPALIAFVLYLGLVTGYHTVLEWQFGKTIGKYLVGIRVTEDDGSSLTFQSSLVRNVLRFIDFLPGLYVLGIFSVIFSDQKQRLGDRFGSSVVVRS
jgi:uncharacterized RDD family membrane protein YckC